jgi:ribosomal protein L39E
METTRGTKFNVQIFVMQMTEMLAKVKKTPMVLRMPQLVSRKTGGSIVKNKLRQSWRTRVQNLIACDISKAEMVGGMMDEI